MPTRLLLFFVISAMSFGDSVCVVSESSSNTVDCGSNGTICIYADILSDASSNASSNARDNETSPGEAYQFTMQDMFANYIAFRHILSWVSLAVILCGLFGNLVSFFILTNLKMRSSTNVFLASLCVSGFMALLGLLFNSVLYEKLMYYKFQKALDLVLMLYPFVYPLIATFQVNSAGD